MGGRGGVDEIATEQTPYHQLLHSFRPGPAARLVRGNDNFLNAAKVHMQWPEGHCCDGGGTVWVRDERSACERVAVDLRYHERNLWSVSEGTGVVDHHGIAAGSYRGRVLFREVA